MIYFAVFNPATCNEVNVRIVKRPYSLAPFSLFFSAFFCLLSYATSVYGNLVPDLENFQYFHANTVFDKAIPAPESYLGFGVGRWHLTPHQIHGYFEQLLQKSNNIQRYAIGRSHQQQALNLYAISQSKNLQGNLNKANKLRIWLGFSIHGNEPSGANSSVLLAYYLLASQDPGIQQVLKDTIIIIEPTMNPDGLERHAAWVNSRRNSNVSADPFDTEHNEPWPGARTNHYWFDLNRDWLLLEHPESRARIAWYHRLQPHVFGDFHEMGANNHLGSGGSYFFQPGVPLRKNPLIPNENAKVTKIIGDALARHFDRRGQQYFNEEVFDDFYVGKGSTYPDVTGGIGILYEQASSKGAALDSQAGHIRFPQTIFNQFEAALQTIRISHLYKNEVMGYRQKFVQAVSRSRDREDKQKAYIFKTPNDKALAYRFITFLQRHQISVKKLTKNIEINDQLYKAQEAFVIPLAQSHYLLIKAIFEENKKFAEAVFYDVSSWNVARAYGINYSLLPRGVWNNNMVSDAKIEVPVTPAFNKSNIGYVIPWEHSESPQFLSALLNQGLKLKASTKPLAFSKLNTLSAGALFLPTQQQPYKADDVYLKIKSVQKNYSIPVYSLTSMSSFQGHDLGSPSLKWITQPKVALLVGEGINPYNAGETWAYFDKRLNISVSKIHWYQLPNLPLNNYTHVLMPSANYAEMLSDKLKHKLANWVRAGGVVVAFKKGSAWIAELKGSKLTIAMQDNKTNGEVTRVRSYAERSAQKAEAVIGGAIVEADVDITHPLGFGYTSTKISVLKRGDTSFELSSGEYDNVGRFTEKPLISGFIGKKNLEHLSGKGYLFHQSMQKGHWVAFADAPNFRHYWLTTNRLLANAIFMVSLY